MGRKRTEFLEEGEVPASNLLIADHYRQQLGELSLTRGFAHGLLVCVFSDATLPRGVRSERRSPVALDHIASTEACLGDGPSRALGLSGRMARPNATTCS